MENERNRIVDQDGLFLRSTDGNIDYKIVHFEEAGMEKLFLCAVGDGWSDHIKGTVLFKLTDTGNGIKIDKKYLDLLQDGKDGAGYDTMEYLNILLKYRQVKSETEPQYEILLTSNIYI